MLHEAICLFLFHNPVTWKIRLEIIFSILIVYAYLSGIFLRCILFLFEVNLRSEGEAETKIFHVLDLHLGLYQQHLLAWCGEESTSFTLGGGID